MGRSARSLRRLLVLVGLLGPLGPGISFSELVEPTGLRGGLLLRGCAPAGPRPAEPGFGVLFFELVGSVGPWEGTLPNGFATGVLVLAVLGDGGLDLLIVV